MSLYPQFDPDAYLEKIRNEAAATAAQAAKLDKCSNAANAAGQTPEFKKITALETDPGERAAICEFDGQIPREWSEGFAQMQCMTPPASIRETRWLEVLDDCGRFLDSWGAKLAALGWSTGEVFGVHPGRPEARLDARGLVWALRGRKVIAAASDRVVIETVNGNKQSIYRKVGPEAVPVWEIK